MQIFPRVSTSSLLAHMVWACVLWLWVQLPYPVLCFLGTRMAQWRDHSWNGVNLSPVKTWTLFPTAFCGRTREDDCRKLSSLGMALVETGMAWFWPDSRDVNGLMLKGWITLNAHKCKIRRNGCRRPFYVAGTGRPRDGLCQPMMATYRPHNNQLMEWGRPVGACALTKRWSAEIICAHCWCTEERWSGMVCSRSGLCRKGSSFAPFFAVENVATTNVRMSFHVSLAQPC